MALFLPKTRQAVVSDAATCTWRENATSNRVPLSKSEGTEIRPSCARTIWCTMNKPKPRLALAVRRTGCRAETVRRDAASRQRGSEDLRCERTERRGRDGRSSRRERVCQQRRISRRCERGSRSAARSDRRSALRRSRTSVSRLGSRKVHGAGGLRVSELVGLRLQDIRFDGRLLEVCVHGKGRKERALLLWKEVGMALRAWLALRGEASCPEVFLSARGEPMTRSGFEYILRKHARSAAAACPSLASRRVSPHVLRHTCALTTLRGTGDLRKVALWLGHASQKTTEDHPSLRR